MTDLMSRIAGAPITWGVDGSPGWGHLMDKDRVLGEMADIGLSATELGPDGYLPIDPDGLAGLIDRFGLSIVGGFIPAVLYRPELVEENLDYLRRAAATLAGVGARVAVLGPASHLTGYDTSVEMSEEEWTAFLVNLRRAMDTAEREGVTLALHPHWGMAIERPHHVERLLESSDVGICIDTGHLLVGGADPVEVTKMAASRVRHVHLKDVDAAMADRVRAGELGFRQAVIDGMFKPLGAGDVDILGVIQTLERAGFDGWYVLEQDCSLTAEPPEGGGPVADAARSLEYLRSAAETAAP